MNVMEKSKSVDEVTFYLLDVVFAKTFGYLPDHYTFSHEKHGGNMNMYLETWDKEYKTELEESGKIKMLNREKYYIGAKHREHGLYIFLDHFPEKLKRYVWEAVEDYTDTYGNPFNKETLKNLKSGYAVWSLMKGG